MSACTYWLNPPMAKKKNKKQRNKRRVTSAERREAELDEVRPNLTQRCVAMGLRPTASNLKKVRDPKYGDPIAQKIMADEFLSTRGATDLCVALKHIQETYSRYLQAIDAPSPNPKNAAIAYVPDRMDSGTDHYTGPSRTPLEFEERCVKAIAAFERMEADMGDYTPAVIRIVTSPVLPQRLPIDFYNGIRIVSHVLQFGRKKRA